VLSASFRSVAGGFGIAVSDEQAAEFAASVALWPPFVDSPAALHRLQERFRLGVITNCDDDLFAASARQLGVEFSWTVTAAQARAYKPSTEPFRIALERIGEPLEAVVHVAQSLYHDHTPGQALGLKTVWIDRRGRPGGATPPAAAPYDEAYSTLAAFADVALSG
jgi:2-haloacid dehalogenase